MSRIFLFFTALLLSAFLISSPALAVGTKVGYISVQGIVTHSNIGKKAKAEQDAFRVSKNKEVEREREALSKLSDALQKERQRKDFDRVKFAASVEKFQKKKKKAERFVEDLNAELISRDNALVQEIILKAASAVKEIAEQEGYAIVLRDPKGLAYLSSEADLTKKVVDKLNSMK